MATVAKRQVAHLGGPDMDEPLREFIAGHNPLLQQGLASGLVAGSRSGTGAGAKLSSHSKAARAGYLAAASAGDRAEPALTPRERQVLRLVANGFSSREVASCLKLSTRTVQNHRAAIMKKLRVKGLARLVRYALAADIIKPDAA